MLKPFSQACEKNAGPILEQLNRLLHPGQQVFEIGSGTGQHAVCFGEALPHIQWQTSDLLENHEGINLWLAEAALNNVLPPVELDVCDPPEEALLALSDCDDSPRYDVIFTANTLHILSWPAVKSCFQLVDKLAADKALLIIYGPFNYGGEFTSDSNLRFDQWLKATDAERGIRDFERVDKLAEAAGFTLLEDIAMPANNRLLVWQFQA